MEGLEALRREYTFKKSTLRLRYSYAIRFLRSLFGISLRAVLVVSLYFNERRRAGVRCAVTDVGEERNQHRGRALAQCLVASQHDFQKFLRQLFLALRPKNLCCFHVGVCGAAVEKPIDLELGFQVHWVHIKLGFPALRPKNLFCFHVGVCGAAVDALAGGSELNSVPAATDRSRHHRSRSTWGLVSRSIGPISSLVSIRAKVPGDPM
jgi:hypothetical protein